MMEKGWRWCGRNPLAACLAALFTVTLIAGTLIASLFAYDANEKRIEAERAAVRGRESEELAASTFT